MSEPTPELLRTPAPPLALDWCPECYRKREPEWCVPVPIVARLLCVECVRELIA